jgi:hypothetical protein
MGKVVTPNSISSYGFVPQPIPALSSFFDSQPKLIPRHRRSLIGYGDEVSVRISPSRECHAAAHFFFPFGLYP